MSHAISALHCATLILTTFSLAASQEFQKINNDQIRWHPSDSLKVFVHFTPDLAEKMGPDQKSPARHELLKSLSDEHRWVAAHCILVSRYLPDAEVESKAISNGYAIDYAGLALRLTYDFANKPVDANGKAIFTPLYENVEDQQKKLIEFWKPKLRRPLTHSLTADRVLVGAAMKVEEPLVRRLLCLSREGREIWHADHPALADRASDWRGNGFHTRPTIKGDRLFYYSNRAEVICADLNGFADGENDRPFQGESLQGAQDIDIVWKVDLIAEHQVYKRDIGNMGNHLPTIVLDDKLAYLNTMHGNQWLYDKAPKDAPPETDPPPPSCIALDQATGAVVWKFSIPTKAIRRAQWTTPAFMENPLGNRKMAFAAGDAVLYCLDPASGKADWKYELDSPPIKKGFVGFPAGQPCVWEDLIIQGIGYDDFNYNYSVTAVTREGKLAWRFTHPDLMSCNSRVLVKDGVAFVLSNSSGHLFALDARTGALHTVREMPCPAQYYISAQLQGDRLLVPTPDGLFEYTSDKLLTPTRYCDIRCDNDITIDGKEIFWGEFSRLYCGEWADEK